MPEQSAEERIKDLERQLGRMQDAANVIRAMAVDSRDTGEPMDTHAVGNLLHAGHTQGEVFVAQLHELRITLGTLLRTQDRVLAHTYEHGAVTHEEISTIYADQYAPKRAGEEGRTMLARMGRFANAVLRPAPYAPVEEDITLDSIVADMSVAANRLRTASAAPVPKTTSRSYSKGWKDAMEAAVAAYRGKEKWLL